MLSFLLSLCRTSEPQVCACDEWYSATPVFKLNASTGECRALSCHTTTRWKTISNICTTSAENGEVLIDADTSANYGICPDAFCAGLGYSECGTGTTADNCEWSVESLFPPPSPAPTPGPTASPTTPGPTESSHSCLLNPR